MAKPEPTVGPLSVTFEEIMAKLIKFDWRLPPGVGLEEFLSAFVNEHPIERDITVDILTQYNIPKPDAGLPVELPKELRERISPSKEAKQADAWLTAFHTFQRAFDSEVESDESLITMLETDTAIPRYCVRSVALWAETRFGEELPGWRDGRRLNVFADPLPQNIATHAVRSDAYAITLATLLRTLLSDDYGGRGWIRASSTRPADDSLYFKKSWQKNEKKNDKPYFIERIVIAINGALTDIDQVQRGEKYNADAYRARLKEALSLVEGNPWDRPPPYSDTELKYVRPMIAAFTVLLAEEEYLKKLSEAKRSGKKFRIEAPNLGPSVVPAGIGQGSFRSAIEISMESVFRT